MRSGERLGPYEIVASLGAGGMGEVYRARDSRLARDVAIKVLRHATSDDAQARFEREAQALAALNHPNIAAIHDVVDESGARAIVMEFVAGRTLGEIMADGPLPIRTALGYAIAICDALAAAHAAGIVHRDLKPANVIVTSAGGVKVLDFGIAKLVDVSAVNATDSDTLAPLTAERTVIGTAGYMSPEQVHGRAVDPRSDVFSLGVLLYEMLAGRRAFTGDSTAGVLSAVLRDDPPPLHTLAPTVPRSVERIAARCLDKDPRQRYQTAVDLKRALEDAREDLATLTGTQPSLASSQSIASGPAARRAWRRMRAPLGYAALGAVLGALVLAVVAALQPPLVPSPRHSPFVVEDSAASAPTWAPDGNAIAFLAGVEGTDQLFVRSLDAERPTQLTRGNSHVIGTPTWSPDGEKIYFYRDERLLSVGIAGGDPSVVAADVGQVGAVAVAPDGRILLARLRDGVTSLSLLDPSGKEQIFERPGLPAPLRQAGNLAFSPDGAWLGMMAGTTAFTTQSMWLVPWGDGVARQVFPEARFESGNIATFSWLPDSRRVVFSGSLGEDIDSRVFLGDTRTGAFQQLTSGTNSESGPSVSPDGARIAYVSQRRGFDLIALPVDGGPPQPMLRSSRNEWFPDMSPSGTLVYVSDANGGPTVRLRTETDAWSRTVGRVDRETTALSEVRLSPDGQRIAVDAFGADHLVVVQSVAGGAAVRIDRESTDQHAASWSPDGNWVAYRRLMKNRWELVRAPIGGGAPVLIAEAEAGGVGSGGPTDWSANGAWIAHILRDGGIHLVAPDGKAQRVLSGTRPAAFRFSRDGSRLLAIRRGASRRWELATWDVETGRQMRVVELPIAVSVQIGGMALSPDESRVIIGAGAPTSDIWLLAQFQPPAPWWRRWFSLQ